MSRYHAASASFEKEAGLAEIGKQLASLLGSGANTLSDAMSAIKKLGLTAVRKLLSILGVAVKGMAGGTKSRFAAAAIAMALSSGAAQAGEVVINVTRIDPGVTYVQYRRSRPVIRLHEFGWRESDITSTYRIHIGIGRRDDSYQGREQDNRYDRTVNDRYQGQNDNGYRGQGDRYRSDRYRGRGDRYRNHRGDDDVLDIIKRDVARGVGEGLRHNIEHGIQDSYGRSQEQQQQQQQQQQRQQQRRRQRTVRRQKDAPGARRKSPKLTEQELSRRNIRKRRTDDPRKTAPRPPRQRRR